MNKLYILITACIILSSGMHAQQTVGLFTNTPDAFNGYTLFAPVNNTTTYLINNCGEKVHSWPSQYVPALSGNLLENGILVRLGKQDGPNKEARVLEMIDWDGNVIWNYMLPLELGLQHHDFEMMPNGNILMLVSAFKTQPDITQAGGDPALEELKTEKVIEIQPDLISGGGTIVWTWEVWDHLIQDRDPSYDHFGTISEHPERIDINYRYRPNVDWLHTNGIDYHAGFDQIMLTLRGFSECWIIDHSTSTEESAGSTGGTYGKGGDLLYRWGNPQSYGQGDAGDQVLFLPHDGHWIPESVQDGGKIMVFNNESGTRDLEKYSSVDIIDPPVDINGFYAYTGGSFAPEEVDWTYKSTTPADFYSKTFSSGQRLENGNTLICEANTGKFFEISPQLTIVWEYVNPVNADGPIPQFSEAANNDVFRCIRYAPDYAGFEGRTLTSQGYIEPGSTHSCNLFTDIPFPVETTGNPISIYPNPANNMLYITGYTGRTEDLQIACFSVTGQPVLLEEYVVQSDYILLNLMNLTPGFYIFKVSQGSDSWTEGIMISE